MVQEIGLPFPVFKWKPGHLWYNIMHMFGVYGTTVTPHVLMTFNSKRGGAVGCSYCSMCSFCFKFFLLMGYVVWQLYCKKSYLRLAPIEGTSRLQVQHPVKSCNPLTKGCNTDFRGFDQLPYCKQHHGEVDGQMHQETCEYFDEFDIQTRGYMSDSLLIPTRETVFEQKILCGGREAPCDKKYEALDEETIYVADIESFTLLIDHSMVCHDLGVSSKSWDMVGFYESCPGSSPPRGLDNGCQLKPIQRHSDKSSLVKEKEEDKTFKMWTEPNWLYTFLPFFGNSDLEASAKKSPFIKIANGDIIKVSHLLDELGINLDEHRGASSRRHSGLVIVIDIEYTNYKSFSWPNHLPPVYKYKVKLSPADEYKVMKSDNNGKTSRRQVVDSHGIYIIINSQGYIGVYSGYHLAVMLLGALALEGFARYVVTMYALNCVAGDKKDSDQEPEEIQADGFTDLIAREVDVPTFAATARTGRGYSQILAVQ